MIVKIQSPNSDKTLYFDAPTPRKAMEKLLYLLNINRQDNNAHIERTENGLALHHSGNVFWTKSQGNKLLMKTKPWSHQREALKYFLKRDKNGDHFGTLFTDMGSGKTKIMIDLINTLQLDLVLIVAPKKAAELVWEKEIEKHSYSPFTRVLQLTGVASKDKATKIKEWMSANTVFDPGIIIVNYDSVWRKPFRDFLLKLPLSAVVCDELHRIKSPGSKCSRFLHLLSKRVKYRYGMTGTPLGQSPLDIYAQYRFINESIFGTNMRNFTDEYANMIDMGHYRMLDKRHPFKNLDELREKMFSCAFTTNSEQELPPTTEVLVDYMLPTHLEKKYRELQEEGCLMLSETEYVDTKNILSLLTRLQQIVNGYLPVTDINTGETRLEEFDTYRHEVLQDLLENIPQQEKIVIFCKYRKDIEDIINVCNRMERSWSELSGRYNGLDEWIFGKDVLIVQIQAGAEGIDLTSARYCIDYDLHYSLLLYKQSRKRVHRPGQTRPVVYYTIMAKMSKGKTVDERIYESLQRNENVIQKIMDEREI